MSRLPRLKVGTRYHVIRDGADNIVDFKANTLADPFPLSADVGAQSKNATVLSARPPMTKKRMTPMDLRTKRLHLEDRARLNAELHRRLKAEAMERWNEKEAVCIKPRCLSKRHAKGYCKIHYDRERRRERIQPR